MDSNVTRDLATTRIQKLKEAYDEYRAKMEEVRKDLESLAEEVKEKPTN